MCEYKKRCNNIWAMLEKAKEDYRMAKKEPALVAFIDVLGFKNIVNQQPDRAIMITILLKIMEEMGKDKFRIYSFSDCMYIVCKLSAEEKDTKLKEMIEYLSYIQVSFLLSVKQYFRFDADCINKKAMMKDVNMVRGALTYGEIVLSDEKSNVILGKAVNKAYVLENTRAKCPGILIDTEVLKKGKDKIHIVEQNGKAYIDFLEYCKLDKEMIKEIIGALENDIKKYNLRKVSNFCESPLEKIECLKNYLESHLEVNAP